MKQSLAIKQLLEQSDRIAIFGHEHIDGDALGAILALGAVLEKKGKKVSYFTPTPPSRFFWFLKTEGRVLCEFDYGEYDVLVFLDFNHYKRIGAFTAGQESYFDPRQKIIIDHHKPDQELPNVLIYRDVEEIATCSLLTGLLREWWGEVIDPEIATYLYMGLSTDSGNFRYDEGEQSIRTFQVALDLLKLGANKKLIIDEIFRNKTYTSVEFMQLLLQRMQKMSIQVPEYGQDFHLVYSYYDDVEFQEYELDHDEADYGLYIMQDIKDNDLVVLIKKVGIYIKGSLRSRGKIDCAALAAVFGGGGHHNAAGFKIQGSGFLEMDIKQILVTIEDWLCS